MMITLRGLLATLCDIEVKGRENLDKLLGCILAVEALIQAEGQELPAEETEEEADG